MNLATIALAAFVGTVQDAAPVPVVAVPSVAAPMAAGPAAVAPVAGVPARTVVEIEIMQALGSKTSKGGDRFPIRLSAPLVFEGRTVLPAGLMGEGEVVHAAKARAMGKAGELVLAARHLDCPASPSGPARRIALGYFKFGMAGDTRAVEAFLIPFGMFIGGGQVDVAPGTRANAQTKEIIELPGMAEMACPAPAATQTAAAGEVKP